MADTLPRLIGHQKKKRENEALQSSLKKDLWIFIVKSIL